MSAGVGDGLADQRWRDAVYAELRGLAGALMDGERDDHTLEPTALVHETWLRLRTRRTADGLEQGAFLGLAALAMRRILTDPARGRAAAKRGSDRERTTLAHVQAGSDAGAWLIDVHRALADLEAADPELARVVELRFFGGCSTAEIAGALGLSTRTVKRRWRFARAWLTRRMSEETS
jgi:RNA polymerase sigma factor (TIGR02999 family)